MYCCKECVHSSLCVCSLEREANATALAALSKGHKYMQLALRTAKPFVNKQIVTFQQVM